MNNNHLGVQSTASSAVWVPDQMDGRDVFSVDEVRCGGKPVQLGSVLFSLSLLIPLPF